MVLGLPASVSDTTAFENIAVTCSTAAVVRCGAIIGIVMYHSSCQRLRMPSIAPAS